MEKKTEMIVCAECGKEKPVSKFQMTRWGHLTNVCLDCVAEKRKKTLEEKKRNEAAKLDNQINDARKLRLADFTPRELMMELRSRGYEGELKYVEVRRINLSQL